MLNSFKSYIAVFYTIVFLMLINSLTLKLKSLIYDKNGAYHLEICWDLFFFIDENTIHKNNKPKATQQLVNKV